MTVGYYVDCAVMVSEYVRWLADCVSAWPVVIGVFSRRRPERDHR
jgi:hypothetical protein